MFVQVLRGSECDSRQQAHVQQVATWQNPRSSCVAISRRRAQQLRRHAPRRLRGAVSRLGLCHATDAATRPTTWLVQASSRRPVSARQPACRRPEEARDAGGRRCWQSGVRKHEYCIPVETSADLAQSAWIGRLVGLEDEQSPTFSELGVWEGIFAYRGDV